MLDLEGERERWSDNQCSGDYVRYHRILHPTDLILNRQFGISATGALSVKHKTKHVSSVGSWELLTSHC